MLKTTDTAALEIAEKIEPALETLSLEELESVGGGAEIVNLT